MTWVPDPRRPGRLVHVRGGSLRAKMLAERRCRLCERPAEQRKITKHRLVPGRLGGRYIAANVVPLCWPCHESVERDVETRRMLRPKLWPEEVAHVIGWLRQPWLDRMYPMPAAARLEAVDEAVHDAGEQSREQDLGDTDAERHSPTPVEATPIAVRFDRIVNRAS
jgi:hypothetical protein